MRRERRQIAADGDEDVRQVRQRLQEPRRQQLAHVGRELVVVHVVVARLDAQTEDAPGLERRLIDERQQATRLLLVRADEDAGERLLR